MLADLRCPQACMHAVFQSVSLYGYKGLSKIVVQCINNLQPSSTKVHNQEHVLYPEGSPHRCGTHGLMIFITPYSVMLRGYCVMLKGREECFRIKNKPPVDTNVLT